MIADGMYSRWRHVSGAIGQAMVPPGRLARPATERDTGKEKGPVPRPRSVSSWQGRVRPGGGTDGRTADPRAPRGAGVVTGGTGRADGAGAGLHLAHRA